MNNTHYFSHGITNPPVDAIPKHATRNITTAQVTNNLTNNPRQEIASAIRNTGRDVNTFHHNT
jgi:hypothetical protein